MNTTVSSRHTASKQTGGSSSSSSTSTSTNALLPSNTTAIRNRKYDKKKGKKKNNVLFIVIAGFLFVWIVFGFWGYTATTTTTSQTMIQHHPTASYSASNVRIPQQQQHLKEQPVVALKEEIIVHNKNKNDNKNPYEGWQPIIRNTEQDSNNNKKDCNSWRTCFAKTNTCPAKCRDSLEDFGTAPPRPRPGFVPDPYGDSEDNAEKAVAHAQALSSSSSSVEWIPDVTVLRRMLTAGKDEHGNPWPPPLVTENDRELCEEIGVFGGRIDDNILLLNAVPIRGMPLLTLESSFETKKMKRQPRILCMVYTMEENHHTSIRAIRETWAPGCDGFLAFSTKDDPRIPAISLPHDGPEEYGNMWQKVRSIWRFVGKHYLEDFDFFFQGGEDLYVLPQNLRNYLADAVEDPTTEDFFGGRRFQQTKKIFFNSGGAGYTLSQATLRKFVNKGLDHPQCFPQKHSAMEDVFIARCLKDVFDIGIVDTRDEQGRERFHPFSPGSHYSWTPPVPPQTDWYESYNRLWPPKLKEQCCAPDSVSFHYMKKPAMVRHIHSLLYFCD